MDIEIKENENGQGELKFWIRARFEDKQTPVFEIEWHKKICVFCFGFGFLPEQFYPKHSSFLF